MFIFYSLQKISQLYILCWFLLYLNSQTVCWVIIQAFGICTAGWTSLDNTQKYACCLIRLLGTENSQYSLYSVLSNVSVKSVSPAALSTISAVTLKYIDCRTVSSSITWSLCNICKASTGWKRLMFWEESAGEGGMLH